MTRKEIGEAVGRKMAEKKIKANHFRKIGLNDLTMHRILKGQNYRWVSLVAVLGELGMDFKIKKMEDIFNKKTKRTTRIAGPEDLKKVIQDRMDEYDEDANGIGMDCDMNPDTIRRVMRTGGGTMVSIEKIFDYLDLEVVVE